MGLFTKLFGTYSDRELKKIYPIADAIEKLEPQVEKLSDGELRAKTEEFNKEYIETCVSDSSAFVEGVYFELTFLTNYDSLMLIDYYVRL